LWQKEPTHKRGLIKRLSFCRSLSMVEKFYRLPFKVVVENGFRILRSYESLSPLAFTILLGYILLVIQPFSRLLLSGDGVYPLVTVLLYSAGFTLFSVNTRYLWIVFLLLMLMGGRLLDLLFQSDFFTINRKKLALLLFMACAITVPTKALVSGRNEGKDKYVLSKQIESKVGIKSKIASNSKWEESLHLTYYLKGRYYGTIRDGSSEKDLKDSLRRNDIDYYIVWGQSDPVSQELSNHREVTGRGVRGLNIYSLKEG